MNSRTWQKYFFIFCIIEQWNLGNKATQNITNFYFFTKSVLKKSIRSAEQIKYQNNIICHHFYLIRKIQTKQDEQMRKGKTLTEIYLNRANLTFGFKLKYIKTWQILFWRIDENVYFWLIQSDLTSDFVFKQSGRHSLRNFRLIVFKLPVWRGETGSRDAVFLLQSKLSIGSSAPGDAEMLR